MTETFGQLLKRHRFAVGLSMNRLAQRAGCDPAYVMRLERDGHQTPSRVLVLDLADGLGLNPRETDRFLYAAGLSTVVDWQTVSETLLAGGVSDMGKRRAG